MTATRPARRGAAQVAGGWLRTWPGAGVAVGVALMVLAVVVPAATGWQVHAGGLTPLGGHTMPRWGPGTAPALLIALGAAWRADRLARALRWPALLGAVYLAGLGWLLSLALVDGRAGLARQLDSGGYDQVLPSARSVHDIGAMLRHFIARIPAHSAGAWPTHVAGHPPGMLLFFVLLVRAGLGGGLAAGLVVTVVAATVPVAVVIAVRRLADAATARRVAPILTFAPAAIWSAVSSDAVFAAALAWGLCALALAATGPRALGWSVLAGLLFGATLMLSYGLALAVVLALAVLWIGGSWRPLPGAALGAVAVLGGFAVAGFGWWTALPALRTRYYEGLAHLRPAAYWLWGDLAALCFCAGPALGASIALVLRRIRVILAPGRGPSSTRAIVGLVVGAASSIALADASLMSKAEVERIWLPFVPWLLLGVALLPDRWRRRALVFQLLFALVVQSVFFTDW